MQIRRDDSWIRRELAGTTSPGVLPCLPAAIEAAGDPGDTLSTLHSTLRLARTPHAPPSPGPSPRQRLESLALRALSLVSGSLSPTPALAALQVPMPLLGFAKAPPDIPEVVWKACGKDAEQARPHADRLRALSCSDGDRATITATYARLLGKVERSEGLVRLLDALDGKPDPAARFDALAGLFDASGRTDRASADLDLAEGAAKRAGVPLRQAAECLGALRSFDPCLGAYHPHWTDLSEHLDFVLGGGDEAARARREQDLLGLCKLRRPLSAALEQARRLDALPPARRDDSREAFMALAGKVSAREDASLVSVLDLAGKDPDPAAVLDDFSTLVDAGRRTAAAQADLAEVVARSASSGVGRRELTRLVKVLRERDPNREDSYEALADLGAALDHVLSGPTADDRNRRLGDVLALQKAGRNASHAAPLAARLERLSCVAQQKATIADDLGRLAGEHGPAEDKNLLGALDRVDGPDALRDWNGFLGLLVATGRCGQSLADLVLAQDTAKAKGLDFKEVVHHVEALRGADPAKGEYYGHYVDAAPCLEETLKPGDAAGRGRVLTLLLSLQERGRSAQEALPFLKEVLALQAGPHAADTDALLATLHDLRKKYAARSDQALMFALVEATASPAPASCLGQFASHAALTGRVDVAVEDLHMAVELAGAHGVPFDEVMGQLGALRKADPAREDSYERYVDAGPTLDVTLKAADAPSRQALLEQVLSLQQRGRTLAHAFPIFQALQALKAGPSGNQEGAVRASLVTVLESYGSREDGSFTALLSDLAGLPDAERQMRQFTELLTVLQRPGQALADLRLARELAGGRKVDQEAVCQAVLSLRRADPALGDHYGKFADLRPALESLIDQGRLVQAGSSTQGQGGVGDLLSLQQKGRNAESALRHAHALAAVPTPPSGRKALETVYVDMLKRWDGRQDDTLLEVLDLAAGTPDAVATLAGFLRQVDTCRRLPVAVADLHDAVKRQAAGGPSVVEGLDLAGTLRRNDPAREDSYENFDDTSAALDWINGAGDAAGRTARAARLVAVQATGRKLVEGVRHEARLDALKTATGDVAGVRTAYAPLLKKVNARSDEHLLKLLDAIDGHPRGPELVECYDALFEASGRADTALADLKVLDDAARRTGFEPAEITRLLSMVRQADPQLQEYTPKPADLEAPLQTVLGGASAQEREAWAGLVATLATAERDVRRGALDLEKILLTPMPQGDLQDAARKMAFLARGLRGEAAEIHGIYERLQGEGLKEQPSWWRSLFRRHGPYEHLVAKVMGLTRQASTVLSMMESLDRCRMEGESREDAFERVKKLVLDDAGEYHDPDLAAGQEALEVAAAPVACGEMALSARWQVLTELTRDLGSLRLANQAFRAMAAASAPEEFQARRTALTKLRSLTRWENEQSRKLFSALTDDLAPGERVLDLLPQLEELLKRQSPVLAAGTWRVTRGMQGFPESDRALVRKVLSYAREGEEVTALWERVQKPVGDESLSLRADLLGRVLEVYPRPEEGLAAFAQMVEALPATGELETVGPPYLALLSLLRSRRGPATEQSRAALDWLRALQVDPTLHGGAPSAENMTPIQDLVVSLTGHLVMGADLERAKTLVRSEEERKARERQGSAGKGVHDGVEEIVVGGVRVRKRR